MTSKIVVNNIESDSGINTVTIIGDVSVGSSITATDITATHHGSGADLTNLPAANLTGTLPAISGANLTGINTAFGSGTSINTSGIITATAFVSDTPLSNRNVIVNGKCQIAQRGTSSTSSGYGSVDRFKMSVTNTDELAFAQKQTSDGPDGFEKCFEFDVTTAESTLAVDELVYMRYGVEAQDLTPFYNANGSGKDFVLSFYVKAYQAGTYQVSIYKSDNTVRFITKTYTISSSGVWQRIELAFTGDTGAYAVDDNNEVGFWLDFKLAAGTNYTSGGQVTTWGSFSNSVFAGGHAVNVLSSTDNYWRITGMQLEVSPVATPFEHLSFAENKRRCGRYCQRSRFSSYAQVGTPGTYYFSRFKVPLTVPMRAAVTGTIKQATWLSNRYFAYKTWSSQTNVTTLTSEAFASSHMGGSSATLDASSKTDVNSVDCSLTVASGSSNSPLPANGPGSNNVYPIEIYDCLLEAEL